MALSSIPVAVACMVVAVAACTAAVVAGAFAGGSARCYWPVGFADTAVVRAVAVATVVVVSGVVVAMYFGLDVGPFSRPLSVVLHIELCRGCFPGSIPCPRLFHPGESCVVPSCRRR